MVVELSSLLSKISGSPASRNDMGAGWMMNVIPAEAGIQMKRLDSGSSPEHHAVQGKSGMTIPVKQFWIAKQWSLDFGVTVSRTDDEINPFLQGEKIFLRDDH